MLKFCSSPNLQNKKQFRVNPGSKAAAKGVREGDLITSINKQQTRNLTNAESHALLRSVKENLLLGLNQDPNASPKRKGHKERYQGPVESLPPQLPASDSANSKGVWSPAGTPEAERKKFDFSEASLRKEEERTRTDEEEPGSAVWTPRSAGASPQLDRKKYRPINFQSPPPQRKQYLNKDEPELPKDLPVRIVSSTSEGSTLSNQNSKLPPAQNPVITLLQKAREGQIPKGAQYLEQFESRSERKSESSIGHHEVFYSVKKEYESDSEDKKKVVELTPRKFEGIGPTTKEGTPIALRSEVKEDNQQKWYKRMYDSLHKADHDNLLPYAGWSSGYLSEPDRLHYDSDVSLSSKYATLDRRRAKSTRDTTATSDYLTCTIPRNSRYPSSSLRHTVANAYKNQPGRIEDYEPGHSSIADKEKQQWLEEVMDIFDGEFKFHSRSESSAPPIISGSSGKSFTSVFKEGGYDSDNTLVFKRREGLELPLEEQKMAYKVIQRGGDVPLHGLRKPAPNKPKEESEIEYFPISPTLTRIRIHKRKPEEKVFEPKAPVFSTYKRTARSSVTPSPPLRHSSRNSNTLKLVKSLRVTPPQTSEPRSLPSQSNIDFIKNRLCCRASKTEYERGRKREKSPVKRIARGVKPVDSSSKPLEIAVLKKPKTTITKSIEPLRKSPELKAPAEVKKVLTKSPKKPLTITVAISPKGKELLKTPVVPLKTDKKSPSPTPSIEAIKSVVLSPTLSDRSSSRPSSKAGSSPVDTPKKLKKESDEKKDKKKEKKSDTLVKNGKKEKVKDDDKNGVEKKKTKKKGENGKKKNGVKKKDKENIPDKLRQELEVEEEFDFPESSSLRPENFFQNLLLRDVNPPQELICNTVTRSSSVADRIKKFNEPETLCFKQEPPAKNLNVYLAQKKPVSQSRFRSLERDPSVESPIYGTYEFFERLDKYDKHNDVWDPTQFGGSPTYDSVKGRSSSEPPHSSPTPSQDIYENIENISPNVSRSPSFRRIKRSPAKSIEGISGVKRKFRSKSLNEADKHGSTNSLVLSDILDPFHYKSYILERLHSSRKSEKFKELHNFYSSLERMAALQKTASNTDLRPRLKGEEVIDYDRWKQLRVKERSEVELSNIYEKLKDMQKEKGFLFKPKETVRWKGDSRLRSKEKSVEDLRHLFQKLSENDECTLGRELLGGVKDAYTPLWRGNSVADLAQSLTSMSSFKRTRPIRDDISPARLSKSSREIGSRLWSSLSMDQVSALKTQLNEIYSTVSDLKRERIEKMRRNLERCEVNVSNQHNSPQTQLHVRSNSLVTKDQLFSPCIKRKQASKVSKADSISALPYLSETEKKKLSMSLSAEVRDRIKKKKHSSLVIPRETLGAVAVKKLTKKSKTFTSPTTESSPRTCYSLLSDESLDKTDSKSKELLLVLTPEESQGDLKKMVDEWGSSEFARVPQTESSSSSTASTVIHLGSKDNLKNKEIYQSTANLNKKGQRLKPSQSFNDLKELFGEKLMSAYATTPLRMLHKTRPYSSTDSLHKYAQSPDTSKYNRSYLNVVKSGEVKKLKEKFESFDDIFNLFKNSPDGKRYQSDPDLARDYFKRIDNDCKKRVVSPVPMKDRTMPRINVISKTAKLQAARRSKTIPSRLAPPSAGQVEKLRRHFEDIGLSILGQMYTSAPDLRDIAPYLACEWAAHRSPSPSHAHSRRFSPHNRPRHYSSPPAIDRRHDYSPYRSSSTPRRPPILKNDPFSDQPFNPSLHTPVARYQPRPTTVTFKEPARPRNYVPAYTPSPESGREYIESEVNIHYKTPVRVEQKEYIEEGELARRQAEALRRIYQQQRRNKYLAELNDIHSRRHQDYFTPSQKSPIPLNRYDDFPVEVAPPRPRDRTPEPKLVARALYNFLGQSSRELSFRRGDIIFVRRQIDKNWYEGEHNAMIGLFPINYVEIIPYDGIRTLPKKSTEGQARAKFNFQAQTHLELSLVKGELVLLTRRVDENWFEGRIGNKKGIFPVSYVQVLVEPGEVIYGGGKPVVTPASHSVMLNGAKDIGSQMQPPRPPSVGSPTMPKEPSQISQLLHIDSRSDPVPYRAMYNYKPQNDDELELREGDVVYVMEKCDDGWYVGSLHRNGQFGTFPGNYVQRIP